MKNILEYLEEVVLKDENKIAVIEEKSQIQQRVTSYQVKNKNIKFEILFKDDIQQEIEDIANPKEYVP